MNNEIVNFKGTADGVRIHLSDSAAMYEILEALEEKINSYKAFFGDGNCRICFDGRTLTGGEKQRLETLVEGLLPLARIEFEAPKKRKAPANEWIVEYKERHSAHANDETVSEHEKPEETVTEESESEAHGSRMAEDVMKHMQGEPEEEFLSVFRSNRARLYQGFVHEGMTMRSDGHLILLGSVEKGGALIAAGNIIVIGGLYGEAHAGCNGHNGSYILAMDMMPQRLRIADASEEYIYNEQDDEIENPVTEPERRGFFEKFKRKSELQEKSEKNINKSEKTAVALWKNNKIVLDNFTIQTFTNLKNMI